MKLILQLSLLWLITSGIANAIENPACHNYTQPFFKLTADSLRGIAASCQDKAVARLYYNRAYYQELLTEGKVLANIIEHNTDSGNYQLTAYRLYIAMLEELAPLYYPDDQQRLAFLNTAYEQRSEVVELRLHGYDQRADTLERNILF